MTRRLRHDFKMTMLNLIDFPNTSEKQQNGPKVMRRKRKPRKEYTNKFTVNQESPESWKNCLSKTD